MNFNIQDLSLQGAKLISPFYIQDERGYFLKSYEKDIFDQWGLRTDVYESFESVSKRGVIRGLHFQTHNPKS